MLGAQFCRQERHSVAGIEVLEQWRVGVTNLSTRNKFKPANKFCTIKDLRYGKEIVLVSTNRNYP